MIQELLPGVFVHTSNVQKLQSVVLVDEQTLCVFDPGYFPNEIEAVQDLCKRFNTPKRDKYLILTHSDFDHIAGSHQFPEYQVLVTSTWDEVNEALSIVRIEEFDSEFYLDRPWIGKMPRVPISIKVDHGQQLANMTFYHAKGHTRDGLVCIYGKTAIVGDYLSAVEFPFIYTSYIAYRETLSELSAIFERHAVDTVITQHGPGAMNCGEIRRRMELAEDYLARAEALVKSGIERGLSERSIVQSGADFLYEGNAIPIGIRSFHANNLSLIYREVVDAR